MNPIKQLIPFGQAIWLDSIDRQLLKTGQLAKLVNEEGVRGLTSNPAIFEKAIGESGDYDDFIASTLKSGDRDVKSLYETLAIRDIRDAADILAGVYEETERADGYVSLEVAPNLARDTEGTVSEARHLWKAVAKPNLMIKVPGTPEGAPAIETLIGEGINVNVTLLFSQDMYEQVALAYIKGLEKLNAQGKDISGVASVASFFVSRIDSAVDKILNDHIKHASDAGKASALKGLLGKTAIANAKLAYERYQRLFSGPRWEALQAKGAHPQRLLWASTSTKNPDYRDVIYIEELIGKDTVNTVPPKTLDAFREHGKIRDSLTENVDAAKKVLADLAKFDISLKAVTDDLLDDAIRLFTEPFDKLLASLEKKRCLSLGRQLNGQTVLVSLEMSESVTHELESWRKENKVRRLWNKDASLWTHQDEAKWMGWLTVAAEQKQRLSELKKIQDDFKASGATQIALLGMGGSSLCPELLSKTFGAQPGFPALSILDSTDPDQIQALQGRLDLKKTLFIVASKSGSTLEPNIFFEYFYDLVSKELGAEKAGSRFIAITDPGSPFEKRAKEKGFRNIYYGKPSIGGRYSALSDFGMVPAAAIGLDLDVFMNRTMQMVHSCSENVPPLENPGVSLGVTLGVLALKGRDKVTFVTSPEISDLGAWLEQLIAESTGKNGKGLIPVSEEKLGRAQVYGADRQFVYVKVDGSKDKEGEKFIEAHLSDLEEAGHPVVRIHLRDKYGLGEEFFRWEVATAVAGSILGIDPFNQPDVEASKIKTRELTDAVEKTGSLPPEKALFESEGLAFYADAANTEEIKRLTGGKLSIESIVDAHLSRLKKGDYFALLAYVNMSESNKAVLQDLRMQVRDSKHVATCLGFGPRFLHSTGQAYKGGPNTGVFIQITSGNSPDLPVPGRKYTFSTVKLAQASGDLGVLNERGRRCLRIHVRDSVATALRTIKTSISGGLK